MRILGKVLKLHTDYQTKRLCKSKCSRLYLSFIQTNSENAESALHLLLYNYNYFGLWPSIRSFQSVLRNLTWTWSDCQFTDRTQWLSNEQHAVDELIESLERYRSSTFWIIYIKENIDDDKVGMSYRTDQEFSENIFKDYYKAHSDKLTELMEQEDFFKVYRPNEKMRNKAKGSLKKYCYSIPLKKKTRQTA